jgi:hypothetical protein
MLLKYRFGYRKLTKEEAASGDFGPKDLRVVKRPECTPVIREMMGRVLRGDKYATIADWLEAEGIQPGPYVENGHWTARVVVELLDDPILSGTRTFRDTICRPIFKTGKHKPTKNAEPETAFHPELAHVSREEHEALRREIARRRGEQVRKRRVARKRQGVPRSRSVWPGQSATCGICGGLMYYAGRHFKCSNALARHGPRCWNHVQVPAQLTRQRVISWLVGRLEGDVELRQTMVDIVWKHLERYSTGTRRRQRDLAEHVAAIVHGLVVCF